MTPAMHHVIVIVAGLSKTGAPNRDGVGGVATPPEFWREGFNPPPDFERTCCLIAHIGPFLIA